MKSFLLRFVKDDAGATMVEYAVVIGVITAAVIVIILSIGGKVNNAFSNVNAAMTGSGFN